MKNDYIQIRVTKGTKMVLKNYCKSQKNIKGLTDLYDKALFLYLKSVNKLELYAEIRKIDNQI